MEAKHIGAIIGSLVAVLIILTIALVTTSLEKLNSFEGTTNLTYVWTFFNW